ncbi:pimeloyl-ACP methyl ester carboxylesterase [Rhizobium sp. PP-F2F-G48]|uniref:alpha/beta fold hydrolase n=1 Tax=Rhizobium sp. PP-F2F-G48 TaxID=2135651 RepID=UPI001052C3C1|nr:alpha/beta hydrolase [Rhizobium sp. PP-F2F-G48]TCM49686.1 pimeloyl-ACP methyl ester carboxylesterase [Rhizobium sp. PP-F2F-G48]
MRKTFTTADGATLSYSDSGSGEVLVLLHGWSQSAAMFRHQIESFSRERRVIALDFRGHGLSPQAQHGYRIYRFAADVAELLRHERIEKASVLGWSLGASVLWAMIDLYGTTGLDRLVFVDEPASVMIQPGMSEEDVKNAGALFDGTTMLAVAAQIAGPEGHAAREGFLGSMITKGIPKDLRDWLLAENLLVDPRTVAELFVNHCAIDWSDLFKRIDRPTLVIGGRVSHVDPQSQEWIHGQVKGSELVIFDESQCGAHFPFIEQPETFNAVLAAFLEKGSAKLPLAS